MGVAAVEGILGGRRVALPAWPPVFCVQGALSPPLPPAVARGLDHEWGDSQCGGRGAGDAARGRRGQPQLGLTTVQPPSPQLARPGRAWGAALAPRLAASGEEEPGARSPWVFAPGPGPADAEQNFTRARSRLPAGRAGSPGSQAGNATFFFFFLKRKS